MVKPDLMDGSDALETFPALSLLNGRFTSTLRVILIPY